MRLSKVEDLAALAGALAVGGCMNLDYVDAFAVVNKLRLLRDGRKWSMRPNNKGTFGIWRRA